MLSFTWQVSTASGDPSFAQRNACSHHQTLSPAEMDLPAQVSLDEWSEKPGTQVGMQRPLFRKKPWAHKWHRSRWLHCKQPWGQAAKEKTQVRHSQVTSPGPHREVKGLQQINGPLIATKENAVSLLIFIGSWSPLRRKRNPEVYNSIYAMSSKEHGIGTDVLKGLLTCKRRCLERLRASALLGLLFLPYLLPARTLDKGLLQSGRQGSCFNNEGRNGT